MNDLVKIENNEIIVEDEEFIEQYANYLEWQKQMDLKAFKQLLLDKMEELGKTTVNIGRLVVTRKKPTTRSSIDSKKLKEELPDIYEEYLKTSSVAGSLSISVLE